MGLYLLILIIFLIGMSIEDRLRQIGDAINKLKEPPHAAKK